MTNPPSRWQRVRRAVAAALRTMAGPPLAYPTMALTPGPTIGGLHLCRRCGRDAVAPLHREPVGDDNSALSLRCGECSDSRVMIAANAQADELDATVDRHRLAIERELERLDAERMAEDLENFVRALAEDLIDAGDFAR